MTMQTSESLGMTTYRTSNEKLGALIAHGGTFVAWFLAPLLVYVLKKNDSRYVAFHAMQSLLWSLAGTVVAALTCGLAIPVFMVFHAIATWKTLQGEDYEYPLVGEVARQIVEGR